MGLPQDVLDLLSAQHGLVTRSQLLALGHSARRVDSWLRRRRLLKVHRGVWRAPGTPRTPEQRILAAVLRAGEGARADGWASCWLLGLEGFEPEVGTLVPFPRQVTGAPFSIRSTVLGPADAAEIRGIPALSAVRAIIEIAPFVSRKRLRVAIDSARRLGLLTIDWLERRALQLRTLHGARVVLEVIGSKALDQESEGERVMAALFHDFEGLEWGVDDLVPGRRLDCLIRDALLVLEYDGRDHHVLPTDRDRDGLRDLEIRSVKVDGVPLDVIHITKGMVDEHPERIRAYVRRRREERRAEIAAAALKRSTEKHADGRATR